MWLCCGAYHDLHNGWDRVQQCPCIVCTSSVQGNLCEHAQVLAFKCCQELNCLVDVYASNDMTVSYLDLYSKIFKLMKFLVSGTPNCNVQFDTFYMTWH